MSKTLSLREVERLNDRLVSNALNVTIPRDTNPAEAIYTSLLHDLCDALETDYVSRGVDECLLLASAHLTHGHKVDLRPILRVLACPRSLIEELSDE